MADWYYGKNDAQHGPVGELEIRTLVSTGTITESTLLWCEGMEDWLPLSQIPALSTQPGNNPYSTPQTYAGQAPYAGTVPTDGLSIASLVCGILAVISCYIWAVFGIPAVICGHMSLKKINNSPLPVAGKGMAIAGLVTGYLGIFFQLAIIAIFIMAAASAAV